MAIFSKLKSQLQIHTSKIKMVLVEVTDLPYGFCVPIFGTVLICMVSYYIFKWLSGDIDVPVRDSSKTHNWKAIKLTAKVILKNTVNLNIILYV